VANLELLSGFPTLEEVQLRPGKSLPYDVTVSDFLLKLPHLRTLVIKEADSDDIRSQSHLPVSITKLHCGKSILLQTMLNAQRGTTCSECVSACNAMCWTDRFPGGWAILLRGSKNGRAGATQVTHYSLRHSKSTRRIWRSKG
jgi:hypothetical protein